MTGFFIYSQSFLTDNQSFPYKNHLCLNNGCLNLWSTNRNSKVGFGILIEIQPKKEELALNQCNVNIIIIISQNEFFFENLKPWTN